MEYLRNWLLQNNAIQLYEDILNYLSAPDCFDSQIIIDNAPTEIRVHLQNQLSEVMRLFATDKALYNSNYPATLKMRADHT